MSYIEEQLLELIVYCLIGAVIGIVMPIIGIAADG